MTSKLNLGCGYKHLEGFLNVDSESRCDPDLVLDLEQTPWPFESSSITEVRMIHVLEHLGRSPEAYLDIIKRASPNLCGWCVDRDRGASPTT